MKVVEIFNSIEGEGKRAGLPATFIRLFGCNLACPYCDSVYACKGDGYTEMSVEEILEKVAEFKCPNVTLTGGEPLWHKEVEKLLIKLARKNYWVNVETNGSIVPTVRNGNIFYTMDYKCPSCGMDKFMSFEAFSKLESSDVLKFVVQDEKDLDRAVTFYNQISALNVAVPQVFVSPVFGEIEPVQIVEYVKEHRLWDWKVQLQLHKFIWKPEERGV